MLASEVGDELFALALGVRGHRTAADDEEVGIRVAFGAFPSAGKVVRLHLEGFGLVESASECLEAYFHGRVL